ncbi:MAG: glutathione S-transferase family protein [Pseudomonas sp.]|uniref:glutathione S-transferase family protein n=1 Tax=Pseudomonas sp. TaxID=306 RepID=UPI003390F85C
MNQRHVTLFHSPHSRSVGVHALLEELGADFELQVLDLNKGQQREAAYLAINPMGKVPAILHGDALVTEQPAVYLYLADLYPEAGLAPAIGDPLRGPYLRWLAFYGSCFEPAIADKANKTAPAPPSMSPYGDFDTMFNTLLGQLQPGPYLLGERFSAADILWGSALAWMVAFGLVPPLPVLTTYIEAIKRRPAVQKAAARDAELAAAQG